MLALVRNIDLIALPLSLPIFVVAGWPLVGWLVGAAIWIAWRMIGAHLDGRIRAVGSDLQKAALYQGVSSIGRGWMLLLALLAAGLLISREVGLAAALLLAVLFTLSLSLRLALRPILDRAEAPTTS